VNGAAHGLADRTQAVLEARARAIARPLAVDASQVTVDAVCFSCGEDRYAIDVASVQRIARLGPVTKLPGVPRYIGGVTNLRGRLIPIVDLGLLLGGSTGAEASHVVAIGSEPDDIALLASAVTGIEAVPLEAGAGTDGARMRPVVGRILADGRALIDAAALLADPRLTVGAAAAHHESVKDPLQ
jgi:purine-binding chemotaxis protein CheW